MTLTEKVISSGAIFLLLLVACRIIGLETGWITSSTIAALIAGILTLIWQTKTRTEDESASIPVQEHWLYLLPAPLLAAVALVWIYHKGVLLPANDPIAIPTLARSLFDNMLPTATYPKGSFGHSYPPGVPALYAYLLHVLSPIAALLTMKITNVLAVLLIPATWAWMWHRVFKLDIPNRYWIPICYLSFWGLERTLCFALPFAGKNALLLGICIAPFVVVAIIEGCQRQLHWLLTAIILFGLILINYSLLHLVGAVMGGYLLLEIYRRRLTLRFIARLAVLLGVTAALVWIFLHDAISDPRAGNLHFTPITGMLNLIHSYYAKLSDTIIFNDPHLNIGHAYYRGAVFTLSAIMATLLCGRRGSKNLQQALAATAVSMIIVLAYAFGIVPAAITLDYARWILWPVQATAFALVTMLLISAARNRKGATRITAVIASMLIFGYAVSNIYKDNKTYHQMASQHFASRHRLASTVNFLMAHAGNRPCILIGDSNVTGDYLSAAQADSMYGYMEAISSCRFGNGSWTNLGDGPARQWDGFPTAKRLKELSAGAYVMLVGRPQRIQPYLARIKASDPALSWKAARQDGISTIYLPTATP